MNLCKKTLLIISLVGILALSSSVSLAQEGKIRIGMSVLELANPFFVALSNAAKEAAAENGAQIILNDPKADVSKQIAAVENFIAAQVDAIIITAQDPNAVTPVIKKAREEGIKVVAHTSELAEYDAWVYAKEYDMGYTLGLEAGKWIKNKLNGQAEVGILNYRIIPQVIRREEGIEDGIHEYAPEAKVVARAQAGSPPDGMAATENFLQAHPDIKVICGINDGGAIGAYEAVRAAGEDTEDFFVGGIDATSEALDKIDEGGIYRATVDQNPELMGKKCVELAIKAVKGEGFEAVYEVPLKPVTKENIAEYIDK